MYQRKNISPRKTENEISDINPQIGIPSNASSNSLLYNEEDDIFNKIQSKSALFQVKRKLNNPKLNILVDDLVNFRKNCQQKKIKLNPKPIPGDNLQLFYNQIQKNLLEIIYIKDITQQENRINNLYIWYRSKIKMMNDLKKINQLNYKIPNSIDAQDYCKLKFGNYEQKKNEIPIKMKKCEICLEEFNEYDSLNYELKCGCIMHYKCFDDYIKNSVQNNNIPILCPNCKTEIHPNLIYDSLINSDNQGLVQKYEKFSMDNYLLNHKDSYSCCPTPGCEYMFFFEQGENHFTCPLCHKDYCLFCKNEWHKGMSCQEYMDSKDINKLDEKFNKFVRGQNYKICPKCGIWVEKTEGCNHMKCRCGADFCYKCGQLMPGGCQCVENCKIY